MTTTTTTKPDEQRKLLTMGWMMVGLTVLIPPVALIAVVIGVILTARGRVDHGVGMIFLALVIFLARLIFWVG